MPGGLKGSASLKAWGYRLSDYKIDFKDFTSFSEEMLSYCIQDVNVTHKLFQHIQKQNIAHSCLELEHILPRALKDKSDQVFLLILMQLLLLWMNLKIEKEY